MKCGILIIVFFILLKIYTSPIFAASLSSNSSQTNITYDQEFVVSTSLSIQAGDGTNYYLRGVFYKEGTTNYCGITWNGSEWFAGPYSTNEGWKKFLKATVSNNSWQGELKAKIDMKDSGCKDTGNYKFKIQRFNEGSGSSSFDDQTELTVTIIIPTQTPTPIPTSKPTPTTKPTSTPKPQPTLKLTVKEISNSPDNKNEILGVVTEAEEVEEENNDSTADPNDFLNHATKSSILHPTQVNTVSVETVEVEEKKNPFITVGGILSLLGSCGILVMRKFRPV